MREITPIPIGSVGNNEPNGVTRNQQMSTWPDELAEAVP